jgi:hypothetical protein
MKSKIQANPGSQENSEPTPDIPQDKLRRAFELWVEFLKRSDSYKEHCQFKRDGKQPPPEFDKLNLRMNYLVFDDVYQRSFEETWQSICEIRKLAGDSPPIVNLTEIISSEVDRCIRLFKKTHHNPPTALELKESLVKHMQDQYPFALYIKVRTTYPSYKKIHDQFKEIVRKGKRHISENAYIYPGGNIRYDELQTYLDVYDRFQQGMKMKAIIEELDSNRDGDSGNILREYRRYLKNARAIIKNVEKGVFPGKYST